MAVEKIAIPEDLKSARRDYKTLQKLEKANGFLYQVGDAISESIGFLIGGFLGFYFLYLIVSWIFPQINAQYFTIGLATIVFLLTVLNKRKNMLSKKTELLADESLPMKAELHRQSTNFNLSVARLESAKQSRRYTREELTGMETQLNTRRDQIMRNLDQLYGLALIASEEAGLQQTGLLAEASDLPRTPVLDQASETARRNIEDTASAIELEEDLSRR